MEQDSGPEGVFPARRPIQHNSFLLKEYAEENNLEFFDVRNQEGFLHLKGDEVVYDLYTGTGTIAQYVARNAKQVIGIEAVQEAIDAAKEHAELNGLTNCYFYCWEI
ncbi:hypothetical protein FQR65_LT18252 [Abscondita terminalis]|nr:hypothetical protein FQR65_LT18252 [Abscondita terminalis]